MSEKYKKLTNAKSSTRPKASRLLWSSLTDKSGKALFQKIYKPAYQLDQTDLDKLKAKIKEVLQLDIE